MLTISRSVVDAGRVVVAPVEVLHPLPQIVVARWTRQLLGAFQLGLVAGQQVGVAGGAISAPRVDCRRTDAVLTDVLGRDTPAWSSFQCMAAMT